MWSFCIHVQSIWLHLYGIWIQVFVYPLEHVNNMSCQRSTSASKFQQHLECLRGKVCNGEVLRRDPDSMLVEKACWITSTHTQMYDMSRDSHVCSDQRPLSRLVVKGNGTEREKEDWENELITMLMLHFIIVPRACLITLSVSTFYIAPPYTCFSYATLGWPTMSLLLRVSRAQVAWHVYGTDSQTTTWKLLILEGDSTGRQEEEDFNWPWLSCIRYVSRAKCFWCLFMRAYLTLVLWGRLFIFAEAHMRCGDPILCLQTVCPTCSLFYDFFACVSEYMNA